MGDGYYADGFWKDGFFAAGYWGGSGTYTATPTEGNAWVGRAVLKKKPSLAFLLACKKFFEAELNE